MPSQSQKQNQSGGGGNSQRQSQRQPGHDPDLQLVLRRLRDLYAQRQLWQQGRNMTLLIRPYSGVQLSLDPVESLVVSCEDPDAHLLAGPLNALIDHYEQLLWLAKIPLPTI